MRRQRTLLDMWLVSCVVFLATVGCGGVYDSTVSGTVTLDSNPVPRGTITFKPVDGGPSAYGQIQSDGSYELRTGREEGAPSGQYQVTVVANEPPAQQRSESGGPPPPGAAITPPWYRSSRTSRLQFNVEPGSNQIDIELSSTPPEGWNPSNRRR